MPGINGLDVAKKIKEIYCNKKFNVKIILASGN